MTAPSTKQIDSHQSKFRTMVYEIETAVKSVLKKHNHVERKDFMVDTIDDSQGIEIIISYLEGDDNE